MTNNSLNYMKRIFIFLLLSIIAIISTIISFNSQNVAYAHSFSGDESASFLTLIEEISTRSHLIEKELINNTTLAQILAQNISQLVTSDDFEEISEKNKFEANSLNESLSDLENSFNSTNNNIVPSEIKEKIKNLDDILGEVVSVRIEKEQLTNNTVKALVLNDLIGKSLQSYGKALGIESDENSEDHESEHAEENDGQDIKVKIVNQIEYKIAQALFNKSIEKFNELKPLISSNMSNLSTSLESSLLQLRNEVNNKASFEVIDDIIDGQVTPHLESIFKIKIEEEE
jgi:hypothetical protein